VRLPIEEGIDLAFDPGHFNHSWLTKPNLERQADPPETTDPTTSNA
jgi:hypothetical protein